jgi:hypothetical protein
MQVGQLYAEMAALLPNKEDYTHIMHELRDKEVRETRARQCKEWGHVVEGVHDWCGGDKKGEENLAWGGAAEIKLMAIANGIYIVVITVGINAKPGSSRYEFTKPGWDKQDQGIAVYSPSPNADPAAYPNAGADDRPPGIPVLPPGTLYLVYDGEHYNPILHDRREKGSLVQLCAERTWPQTSISGTHYLHHVSGGLGFTDLTLRAWERTQEEAEQEAEVAPV